MKLFTTVSILTAALVLSGCSISSWYPKNFDTVTEVYPARADNSLFDEAPETSRTGSTYDAAYYDVFALAVQSVSQNQWNLVSQDEATGTILATRAIADQFWTPNGPQAADRRYHYLIGVEEAGPEQTRVWAVAKTQGACIQLNRGTAGALTLGMSEAGFPAEMKNCKSTGSKTGWAVGTKSVKSELEQFSILLRNNLMSLEY
jgi:hypothetical protein